MTHKLSSDGAAVVTPQAHWLRIDANTPRGVKMMLISEAAGVAQIGLHLASGTHFTHWHPLPTFQKDGK